jgi:hypothetical protein
MKHSHVGILTIREKRSMPKGVNAAITACRPFLFPPRIASRTQSSTAARIRAMPEKRVTCPQCGAALVLNAEMATAQKIRRPDCKAVCAPPRAGARLNVGIQ